MRKTNLILVTTILILVGCQGNNQGKEQESSTENSNSIVFSVKQPGLKSYIKEAYGSFPDIQWNNSPAKRQWTEKEKSEVIQHSNEVLSSIDVVKEIDDYEIHLNGKFIAAKYRAGFNYFILPDIEEPYNNIYMGTEDKAYKLKADKEAVQKIIQWMKDNKE
ncbi:hypothetical protein [Pseudalkalibacillus salsuginis]|uniref:hypothetical protein n=1 Tax=Pseudalkalibacillus salsuginis TaxID=2910972 RepID=UPI001F38DD92|nr:hypothetical protein [Pseudalkalibacillus salsuginis]MCF6409736.1 hypothetical protein [Pseudalkalibacillus salsuginis]